MKKIGVSVKKRVVWSVLYIEVPWKRSAMIWKTDMLEKRILEQLFRRNYSEMIHLARVLLGNAGEAEEVVQDIFLPMGNSDITPKSDG